MKQNKGLILTVGLSKEPLIKTIQEFKPERVVFIGTEQSIENTLDDIIEETSLKPSKYKALDVTDSSESIGKLISKFKEGYNWLIHHSISRDCIVVDPTGGKKWMASGATMIASFLGLEMIYVDAVYDKKLGKIDPSTMKVVPLGNAYDQTGFIVAEQARVAFNSFNYEQAEVYFGNITPTLSHRAEFFRGMTLLTKSLARWDRFEHYEGTVSKDLHDSIALVERSLKTGYSSVELVSFIEDLKVFAGEIENLETQSNISEGFIIDIFFNAKRRFSCFRYDDSVARLYRTLEAIGQFFLLKDHKVDVSKKIYWEGISEPVKTEFQKVRKIDFFPEKLDLMMDFSLLKAFENSASDHFFNTNKKGVSFLFLGLLELRNSSILAHGFKPISREKNEKFIDKIESILSQIMTDYTRFSTRLSVPELPDLQNLS